LTALRLLVAGMLPLAADEAYYWVWSRALAPGYLDHPPMVALWIRAGTALLGDSPLGVRLLAPISAALGSVLLVQAGRDLLGSTRAGLLAALLLNATLLFGVGAVTMTPDTPLLFFWTATLWSLGRLRATKRGRWWLIAGLSAGLAMASKYTAAFLGPGILLWLLAVPSLRLWLRRWQPWAAGLLALLAFAPVLVWNAHHGWIGLAKQAGRVGVWEPGRALGYLAELVGGQIGFATPGIALLCGAGLWLAVRRAWLRDEGFILLAALTVPAVLVFLQHALGDRVQANWPSILYPQAVLAAACLGAGWQRFMRPSITLGFGLTALIWLQAIAAPLPLPMRLDPTLLRLGGWESLAGQIDAIATREHADFVASDNYGHAALMSRLLSPDRPVLGAEGRWALFDLPDAHALIAGHTGLLLRSARRDDRPDAANWSEITPLATLDRGRGGMVAEGFRLYRVTGKKPDQVGSDPLVVLPRPR
jgi:4-amino-4-deoxy-L-arabinose transferase-like glycosyltransferase